MALIASLAKKQARRLTGRKPSLSGTAWCTRHHGFALFVILYSGSFRAGQQPRRVVADSRNDFAHTEVWQKEAA
jgi:hypothetical protein